jgi:hypothetical protein
MEKELAEAFAIRRKIVALNYAKGMATWANFNTLGLIQKTKRQTKKTTNKVAAALRILAPHTTRIILLLSPLPNIEDRGENC